MSPKRITLALNALGETPREIAVSLKNLGMLGYRKDASRCPIAYYLRTKFQAYVYDLFVDTKCVVNLDNFTAVEFPEVIQRFIALFDLGAYPSLIATSDPFGAP